MMPELEADDGRRAPAELGHRPDQEAAVQRREDALQVVDDARRVGDDVRREEDRLRASRRARRPQLLVERGPVDAEQPADAEEREAEAELDRRELGADDEDQREAVAAVGQLGVEDADGLDVDDVLELQLERAGVLAASGSSEGSRRR